MLNRPTILLTRRMRWRFVLINLLLLLPLMSCYSISYLISMNEDGSGAGMVTMTILIPAELAEDGAQGDPLGLAAKGWQNVRWSTEGKYLRMDADYPFDPAAGTGLPDDLDFQITIEEAENEYRYFRLSGSMDLTEMDQWWAENYESGRGMQDIEVLGETIEGISPEEMNALVAEYGVPHVYLRVHLPGQTPVEARGRWANAEAYMSGQTDVIEFVWTPADNPVASLSVTRRLEPRRPITAEEMAANQSQLISLYASAIPAGWGGNLLAMPTGGFINNTFFAHFTDDNYTCGDYQIRVIAFLDGIRNSPDPDVRRLLDGFDYGPIQTAGGSHVAVVLYPSGTDWWSTGTVLDPWPYQRPQTFTIGLWQANLTVYALYPGGPVPDSNLGQNYPHLSGGQASYPATDLQVGQARPVKRILVINSPVTVMVQMADGRRAGVMPDQSFVNELAGEAYFYSVPNEQGGYAWLFYLPEAAFQVTVYGQQSGSVHAMLVTSQGAYGYGAQPIQQMESGTFSVDPEGIPSMLAFESGSSVPAYSINAENLDSSMGFPEQGSASQADAGGTPAEEGRSSPGCSLPVLSLLALCAGVVVRQKKPARTTQGG